MSMNHPLGDMLTRIRNAQMRKRGKVTTPGSTLRGRVLDVLQAEGFIRGYSSTDYGNGRTEFEIELKYFDNEPVIRKIERVSKPGRASMRRSIRCRASPTASASPSFRRRKASWLTTPPAKRTWAAKCCAPFLTLANWEI